ncbi:MAG: hypothetical protein U9N57_05070 [Pseudomonadota bacterium]|nr:hypothetical protein [Pseudomonadota bacterium]
MQYKQSIFKRTALSAAIVATLGLTACGGGGGSSSTDGGTTSFSSATTSGTAAKGILNKGVVTAIELGSDQTELRTLATTVTDEKGTYALTIPASYTNGPIKVSITSDADTEMKCDISSGCGTRADDITDANSNTIVDFGEWYKPGVDNIQMSALVASAASGASLAVNVTPFTTMAAKRALSEPTLDADAVANANSEVSALLGVNVLTTKPVDITNLESDATSNEIAYAALAAAIAESASKDTDGVPDINAAIEALAAGFEDGTISTSELQTIVSNAGTTYTAAGVTDTSGVVSALQDTITDANGADIDPEPADSATVSNVDKAKALVADFRSYANNMDSILKNPDFGGEFKNQVEQASLIIDNIESTQDPLYLLNEVMGLVEYLSVPVKYSDEVVVSSGTVQFPEILETAGPKPTSYIPFESGSMSYNVSFDPETGKFNGTVNFVNAVIEGKTVNLSFTESSTYLSNSASTDDFVNNTSSYLSNSASTDDFVNNTSSYVSQEVDNIDSDITGTIIGGNSSLTITAADFAETETNENNQYDSTSSSSEYTYTGVNTVSLDGELKFTNEGSSTPLVFKGNIALDALMNQTWTSNYDQTTNYYSDTEDNRDYIKNLALDGSLSYGSETIAINTTVSMPNAQTFYDMETVSETEGQWLQISTGLGLTINTVDLQDVALNLSASRTALDKATAQLSLNQGNRSIVMSFETAIAPTTAASSYYQNLVIGEPTGDVKVTDINGTVLIITPNGEATGVIGAVTIDGLDVAIIERTDGGLIKTSYADNTFELF